MLNRKKFDLACQEILTIKYRVNCVYYELKCCIFVKVDVLLIIGKTLQISIFKKICERETILYF